MSQLNPSQSAAVEHNEGPILVLAGAGSGKTRVVTTRIARLIASGVPAWSILAMTFTNKAAAEMRERVGLLTDPHSAKTLRVSTFHSFGLEVLGSETEALGLRQGKFAIFDQADSSATVRELLRAIVSDRSYDVSAILGRISMAKNGFYDETNWQVRTGDEYDEIAKDIFPKYRAALQGFQAFDFDDLVTETVRLLRRREDVRKRWQRKVRYLLVDEYQDTNASQLELVRILCADHHNVMVVGDDDQSIYAWRGADISNILDFERHFKGAQVIKLEENYRSAAKILHLANAVLERSQAKRHGKVLKPTQGEGESVEVLICNDPEVEAATVGDEILKAREADPQLRLRDVAVLYRSNSQAEAIESALRERELDYRVLGGQKFYERKEVKDLLAYLRVCVDPEDEISVRRVINYPARGIGDVGLKKLTAYATAQDLSLWDAVVRAPSFEQLPGGAVGGCRQFEVLIQAARARLQAGSGAADLAAFLAGEISLKEDIMRASPGEAGRRRWGNVEATLRILRRWDQKPQNEKQKLADYLRLLTLQIESQDEAAQDAITLTTMHGSKGLEFPLVFLIGLEEGLLPHMRTLESKQNEVVPQDIEEERRLFYVGVTRAKQKLFLSRSKFRQSRGKAVVRTPSRFLTELPEDLYESREIVRKAKPSPAQIASEASALLQALEGTDGPFGGGRGGIRRPGKRRFT